MSEEISINNQIAVVDEWKPYDFLTFIENEMRIRHKDYQVMDLQADLGAIKTCLVYAKAVGKGNYSVVEYINWLLDGIKDPALTSLQFMTASLRAYYGSAPESALPKPRKAKVAVEVKLTSNMVTWLDSLKQDKLL